MTTLKQFQEEGKTRFIGLSDWSSARILKFIERCNPDVVQPYRNVMYDNYESSGLKNFIEQNNLGVCFFSPLKHGLLTGKYETPASFDTGDHRSGIKEFSDRDIIEKMQENKLLLKQRFKSSQNPVMHGIVNALFSDAPTGCVLLGQRNIQQVEAASRLGDVLSKKDADWVHALYAA
jgi:aryl-alcohol dehydrogenase-like predicted oxidoreductase